MTLRSVGAERCCHRMRILAITARNWRFTIRVEARVPSFDNQLWLHFSRLLARPYKFEEDSILRGSLSGNRNNQLHRWVRTLQANSPKASAWFRKNQLVEKLRRMMKKLELQAPML